jgi:hypothetical protein
MQEPAYKPSLRTTLASLRARLNFATLILARIHPLCEQR